MNNEPPSMTTPSAPNSPFSPIIFQETPAPPGETAAVVSPPGPDDGPTDAPQGSLLDGIFPFLAIGRVLWFLIFAPEKKARKKRQAMLDAIKKGDQVVTTSGLHAEVVAIRDHEVDLMAGSSRFTYSRAAVNEILD